MTKLTGKTSHIDAAVAALGKLESKVYFLAYLPPKEAGWEKRRFIHSFCTTEEMSLEKYREMRPDLFEEIGHYSLLAPLDRIDVQPEKKKK